MSDSDTNDLINHLAQEGLFPPKIHWDGRAHNFPGVGKEKGKAGWVCAFPDRLRADYGCHATGLKDFWINDRLQKEQKEWSPEKREEYTRQWKEDQARKAAEKELQYQEVARAVQQEYAKADTNLKDVPYLKIKKIPYGQTESLRRIGNKLLVSAIDGKGRHVNTQTIYKASNGQWLKIWKEGGIAAGIMHIIGKGNFHPEGRVWIVEGWATGWTVWKTLDEPVVVAFNTSNLLPVAKLLRSKYPKLEIVFAADNDRWTEIKRNNEVVLRNPGVHYARQAAGIVDGAVAIPNFSDLSSNPTDYDDLRRISGLKAVERWLNTEMASEAKIYADEGEIEILEAKDEEFVPFKILGMLDGHAYLLDMIQGELIIVQPKDLTHKGRLMSLADIDWWRPKFPAPTVEGVQWGIAANWLIQASRRKGQFDMQRQVRGRGCWRQPDNSAVIHYGGWLLPPESDKFIRPEAYDDPAGLVYTRKPGLYGPQNLDDYMSRDEACDLLLMFVDLNWADPAFGYLLAGWVALAPVCGWLGWKPHVWIKGETKSGKSTIIEQLVSALLGVKYGINKDSFTMVAQQGWTSPAITQTLRIDARPLVFDEAEFGGSKGGYARAIMELLRSASMGGTIGKGGREGTPKIYQLQSMMCFASIAVPFETEADQSRVSTLTLLRRDRPEEREKHWKSYRKKLASITKKDGMRLMARTFRWMRSGNLDKIIRMTVDIVAEETGDRRKGDQVGTLLAGVYTMMHNDIPQTEQEMENWRSLAISWIPGYDDDAFTDGERALDIILQRTLRVNIEGPKDFTVREMIVNIFEDDPGKMAQNQALQDELRRHGINVANNDKNRKWPEHVFIAKKNYRIDDWMATIGSPTLAKGWPSALLAMDGVVNAGHQRFGRQWERAQSLALHKDLIYN